MDVLTLYVGQGSLVGIRVGGEAIVIDAHMPDCDDVTSDEIKQSLTTYLGASKVRGLILTGFDADHAHAAGVEWILTKFTPDWIMYPKYFKDTDCARSVFRTINAHERRRSNTGRPLVRYSIRIDRLNDRTIPGLGRNFDIELFSPHIEDMDSSNNCSIVAKITGKGPSGFSYLATGDTETERWSTINTIFGDTLKADAMAAAHHGARSGLHPGALHNIDPNTVLISAGVGSQYDHPHGLAIQMYQAVAHHVWATNAGGQAYNLLTRRDGQDFKTTTFQHSVVPVPA